MIWWLIAAGRIAHALSQAQNQLTNARSDEVRIAASIEIERLQARRDTLVAGGSVSRWVQALYAATIIIYVWKLVIWDKVLGGITRGRADPLGEFESNIGTIVVGFYFIAAASQAVFWRR